MNDVKEFIINNNLGKFLENKSFKDYTTLKVGGNIRLVYLPNTIENFIKFYQFYTKYDNPLFVIGSGSNVLASDKYFDGVVVNFSNLDVKYFRLGNKVTAYPSVSVVRLANDLAKVGYTGGEFLAGIPATIGGCVYMNAGANGRETKDILINAKLLDKKGINIYSRNDLKFSYRKSILQEQPLIVLEAKLEFSREEEPGKSLKMIKELKHQRRKTQPIDKLSAGCTFQNPKGFSAWELIEKIGFRGYSVNQAQVSKKHANFLINNSNAASDDLIILIEMIKARVKEKFDIELKCEWILVNFD